MPITSDSADMHEPPTDEGVPPSYVCGLDGKRDKGRKQSKRSSHERDDERSAREEKRKRGEPF